MIQDIYPHQFDNTFVAKTNIDQNDYVFYFDNDSLLLKQNNGSYVLPQKKDVNCSAEGVFLFSLNNVHCYLVWECKVPTDNKFLFQEIRFSNIIPAREIDWASVVALQLRNWYVQHKFCGKCGTANEPKTSERAIVCPSCSNNIYPNIAPAVIVAILKGDKLLLARNANFPEDFYSIIAGFVDVGETVEEAVIREAQEEVGISIKNIRYYKSQPWAYSSSLMIGFIAEADDNQEIIVDNKEIAEAHWYSKDNLPNCPNDRSIAGEMIELFKNGGL